MIAAGTKMNYRQPAQRWIIDTLFPLYNLPHLLSDSRHKDWIHIISIHLPHLLSFITIFFGYFWNSKLNFIVLGHLRCYQCWHMLTCAHFPGQMSTQLVEKVGSSEAVGQRGWRTNPFPTLTTPRNHGGCREWNHIIGTRGYLILGAWDYKELIEGFM